MYKRAMGLLSLASATLTTRIVNRLIDYFRIGPVFRYFINVFRKPDPGKPTSVNLRMMHGINRISIIMFLFAIIVYTVRHCVR